MLTRLTIPAISRGRAAAAGRPFSLRGAAWTRRRACKGLAKFGNLVLREVQPAGQGGRPQRLGARLREHVENSSFEIGHDEGSAIANGGVRTRRMLSRSFRRIRL